MRAKLRIGDRVIIPWRTRRHGTTVTGGWSPGTVVARRRGALVVRSYGHEREYPAHEVRPYPSRWPR